MTREVNLEAIFDTLGEIHSRLIELEQTLREELETTAGPGKLGFSRSGREVRWTPARVERVREIVEEFVRRRGKPINFQYLRDAVEEEMGFDDRSGLSAALTRFKRSGALVHRRDLGRGYWDIPEEF